MSKTTEDPSIADLIYQGYEEDAGDWRRDHLGASILGHRCDRYLWLSFRWAADPSYAGKLLRLFERGQREEEWIVGDLERAGFTITSQCPETGEQYRIADAGHLGGSIDGLVQGLPGDPETVHVLEIKTSNKKQFDRIKEKGVRSAKPQHFVQMQIYMDGRGLERALYVCVCKDTDEIHTEQVKLDQKVADKHKARAKSIIDASEPPAKKDKDFPPCVLTSKDGTRWPCDYFELCHGTAMPERNCRTCVESSPTSNWRRDPRLKKPTWDCALFDKKLSPSEQREGCPSQLSIPPIVNAKVTDVNSARREISYQFEDGTQEVEA